MGGQDEEREQEKKFHMEVPEQSATQRTPTSPRDREAVMLGRSIISTTGWAFLENLSLPSLVRD